MELSFSSGMSDNSPPRQLAPDYLPPMSDNSAPISKRGFAFECVNQIQSQSRGNSASHGYARLARQDGNNGLKDCFVVAFLFAGHNNEDEGHLFYEVTIQTFV